MSAISHPIRKPKPRTLEQIAEQHEETAPPQREPDVEEQTTPSTETPVEVGKVEDLQAAGLAALQPVDAQQRDLILAYGDGLLINIEQAKQDIRNCYGRVLAEAITIGKRLLFIKTALPHGGFLQYLEEEFPESEDTAQRYMIIARRVLEDKNRDVAVFLRSVAGNSKTKALLALGISDEEIAEARQSGEFLGRSLEEVGGMSYRQLKEELRKRERDLEKARTQRDKADSKIEDLQEEVSMLRSGADEEEEKHFSPLEIAWGKTKIQLGRLQVAVQDADEEEILASGPAMLNGLQREVSELIPLLQPTPPGAADPLGKGGGR